MTASGPPESVVARSLKALGVLATVTIAGPLLGGLLAFCCIYPVLRLLGFESSQFVDGTGQPAVSAVQALANELNLFFVMGYAFGGVQAFLTGLWAAWSAWRDDTYSRRTAIIAAIAASALLSVLLYSPLSPMADGSSAAGIVMAITPIAIVGALFTRWLCVKLGLIQDTAAV